VAASGLPLNSVWGTNSGRKSRGVKGMTRFSVHFNLHKPIQIVFFKNFENCRSPFKNETLHQESSQDRLKNTRELNGKKFDNQVKAVASAHMKEYKNKWQTTA
jgi:hypothetical protein